MVQRPKHYQYFRMLQEYLNNDMSIVFSGKPILPRQIEIHLPGNGKNPCNFRCAHCQGTLVDKSLSPYEEEALNLVEKLQGKVPLFVYGGVYTEPLLNPHLLRFLQMTKETGAFFGIHTNGSLLFQLEEEQSFISTLCEIATPKDYLSISLDAGLALTHTRTKGLAKNYFSDIIRGIETAISRRGNTGAPNLQVCYLLNLK